MEVTASWSVVRGRQQRGKGPRPCSTKEADGMTDRQTIDPSIIWRWCRV